MRPDREEPAGVPDADALWPRVAAMERRLRAATAAGLIGVVLAGVMGFGAQRTASQQTREIKVHALEVLDQAGKRRISLTIAKDGNPDAFFYDGAGRLRLFVGLVTGRGTPTPEVLLQDEHGMQRLYMGWTNEATEKPIFFAHDASDKEIWHAP